MRNVPFALGTIAIVACGAAAIAQVAAASGSPASVSAAQAAAVMHDRHEGMETIGKNFKELHRQLDLPSPDIAVVRTSASAIADLSKKTSGWFPAGTGPDVGKTGAKPDIWLPQNHSDFAAKLSAFQKSAQVFNAAATSGDVNGVKARYADLGGACKACHDKYRAEMHH